MSALSAGYTSSFHVKCSSFADAPTATVSSQMPTDDPKLSPLVNTSA